MTVIAIGNDAWEFMEETFSHTLPPGSVDPDLDEWGVRFFERLWREAQANISDDKRDWHGIDRRVAAADLHEKLRAVLDNMVADDDPEDAAWWTARIFEHTDGWRWIDHCGVRFGEHDSIAELYYAALDALVGAAAVAAIEILAPRTEH